MSLLMISIMFLFVIFVYLVLSFNYYCFLRLIKAEAVSFSWYSVLEVAVDKFLIFIFMFCYIDFYITIGYNFSVILPISLAS